MIFSRLPWSTSATWPFAKLWQQCKNFSHNSVTLRDEWIFFNKISFQLRIQDIVIFYKCNYKTRAKTLQNHAKEVRKLENSCSSVLNPFLITNTRLFTIKWTFRSTASTKSLIRKCSFKREEKLFSLTTYKTFPFARKYERNKLTLGEFSSCFSYLSL